MPPQCPLIPSFRQPTPRPSLPAVGPLTLCYVVYMCCRQDIGLDARRWGRWARATGPGGVGLGNEVMIGELGSELGLGLG